ncbi:PREDICTED: pregnancy-specific beta-1-glycoprotein 11-like, partial [Thamnophis sirtalis]|uniref:Pregnancy-specific beta-1-glycoprotein 11-like n=1 Tax=Thamnophis sirtalis TaxID=35019 RepID=A0A6I9Z3R8_9SAUR
MSWIGLILAVLAFAAKLPPSKTLRIAQFPPYPQIGKPVLLFLDDPRSPTSCDWFQGREPSQENHIFRGQFDPTAGIHRINRTGPAYTGQEDLARRCALIVRKIQAADAGPYSVSVMGLDGSHPVTAVRNLQVPYSPFSFHVEAARM